MSGEAAFSDAELASMQATQEAHMMDACTVDAWSEGTADALGNKEPEWTPGPETPCGFQAVTVDEVLDQGADVPTVDGRVRLPIDTTVGPKDRITITKRHGVAVAAEQYEVVGEKKRGPSGLVVELQKVTD